MKSIVLVAALFSSAVAFAMPKVGDYAMINVSLGGSAIGTLENEVVQFDAAKNQYLLRSTQDLMGQRKSNDTWGAGVSDQLINDILTNCSAKGGTPQSITVPAGAFATCALPVNSGGSTGTMWVGMVPFGIVKADITNSGNQIGEELASFKLGK